MRDKSKILVSRNLKNFEEILKADHKFLRSHKSFIINYKLFNTQFQMCIRILLMHLSNYPNKFTTVWNTIYNIFNEHNLLYINGNGNYKLIGHQKHDIINNITNMIY